MGQSPQKPASLVTFTPSIYSIYIYSTNNGDKIWAEGKLILSAQFAYFDLRPLQ